MWNRHERPPLVRLRRACTSRLPGVAHHPWVRLPGTHTLILCGGLADVSGELVLLQFHYRVVVARLGQSRLRLLLRFGPYVCAASVLQDARGGAVRRTIENPITVIAALSGLLGRHSHRCGLHLCLLGEFEASEQRTTGLSWQTWTPRQDRHPRPERG